MIEQHRHRPPSPDASDTGKLRKAKDHSYNYVDRVRLGQSSLQGGKYFHHPRGSGWRPKSISNLDLSTNRPPFGPYIEDDRQLRPSRSLDYKHSSSHKEDTFDIAEFYWRIDPDKDYDKLPHNYLDESGYHSTNVYNQPFDIGNESCSLRRSRSLAVIREETFSDLQISTANSHRRSQLIPRARLVNRGFFKERFTGSKQPTYYNHHHHLHHHHQPTTLDRPLAVPSSEPPPPDAVAVAQPPETTTITRESDEYYENLKRLDAHQQSIWQNEKSDLESLNSEYFRNSHHQSDSNGEKQRLYQSRLHKSTAHRKYSSQLGEESCPELSQSSVFPETTTTSNSDDQSDSLTNSEEQEYDIERVEEILSKVYDEKFEVISLTEEQNQKRAENCDEQGALIAYDSVYLSSEESSEGTVVEEKHESASLLHISIEDIYDPPERPEVVHKEPPENPLYAQVLRVPPASPPSVVDTKPKILAVVEKKKLKRFSDYASIPNQQRRGVLEHLTYISTQSTHHHPLVDNNQYYSLPDVNIGKSLKVSERIDAKLRSSYNLKEEPPKEAPPKARTNNETAAIYDSIKHFGRAHKKARQREQEAEELTRPAPEDEVEKPKEAPSIQVETYSKEIITTTDPAQQEEKANSTESGQFRIIVTDAQNNVIEEDSIDGHTSSLNPEPEKQPSPPQEANHNNSDTNNSIARRTLTRTLSKPKRQIGTITVKSPSDVYKAKDRRAYNTYRARPIKVKPNDSLRCVGNKMSRPQVIQVVDSKRGSLEKKHPLADKAAEDEFLQKVDAIRCYWSKLSQDDSANRKDGQNKENLEEAPQKKKDFIIGQETRSMAPPKAAPTPDDDFQSLMPSIEIVELDGDKQATIVKANPDEPVPEFDHIRYKVMKPNLFRSNMMNRSKKEAQFDGLIQYLQEYSFQELLTNNNVVIVEPVRTKVERPAKASPGDAAKPAGGQNCKITGGAGTNNAAAPHPEPQNTNATTTTNGGDGQNKLSKRHFFYQPVRVNRELLEEELPTPDTVRNVRKFFEENILPGKASATPPSPLSPNANSQQQQQHHTEGRRTQRSRFRYLTIDTSYGNNQAGGGGGGGATLRKWDSVSLSSGISSGDLSSPCECSNGDARAATTGGGQQRKDNNDDDGDNDHDGHAGGQHQQQHQQQQEMEIRGGMHVRDFIRRHNACGSQDSNGLCGDYEDVVDGDEPDEDEEDDLVDDELCESYYVSEDVLEKIRECGSTVTYYGGRVTMHSPPATGATLRIPRSKIEFLTCNSCQPNQCPHKDQLHDQLAKRNYTGIKFKLVKSNSCSSRLELIGTQRASNHPTTIGEDESIDGSESTHPRDDEGDDYDDGEPLVRRLVHRLETTGKINSYTGPRIIESQCIEKTRRPTSLVVTRQKFEAPTPAAQRHSEGFTINNQMVGGKGEAIPESLAYVQLLKQVTVNNHINVPVEGAADQPSFTSSAMDIRLTEKPPAAASDTKLTNGKVRRNKNVDLAFTMVAPSGTMKKSTSVEAPTPTKDAVKPVTVTDAERNCRNVTIVEHFDNHLPKEVAAAKPPPPAPPGAVDLVTDNTLVRHYVTNDKRLFTKPKYDDIEFEEFEVYDPLKDATAQAEQLVEDVARAASAASSLDELKSNPDECYDSLDDKL